MHTVNYPRRKTYTKYDTRHYLVYLNEQPVEYVSEYSGPGEEITEPVSGFSYTGEQEDGGSLIEAESATYEAFVSGLVRKRYSADDVEALQANMLAALSDPGHERAKEFEARWEEYEAFRVVCKGQAKSLLGL